MALMQPWDKSHRMKTDRPPPLEVSLIVWVEQVLLRRVARSPERSITVAGEGFSTDINDTSCDLFKPQDEVLMSVEK